jgi:PAS domain S-box-containing protein
VIEKAIIPKLLERQKIAGLFAVSILKNNSLKFFNTSQKIKKDNNKLKYLLEEKKSQLKGVFATIDDSNLVIDFLSDAFLVIDLEGNVMKMNAAAESFFNYNLQNGSINFVDFIYYKDYAYSMNSFAQLLDEGHFHNYIARISTKNKEIKWVKINASIVYDKFNKAIAAQGIIIDITEQREREISIDFFNNLAKSILGKESITEMAWLISNSIANYLGTNDCVIYLVDKTTNTLDQIAVFDNKLSGSKGIINKLSLPIGKGIVGYVAKSGNSEIISDTSKDKRYIIDDAIRLSEITIPIKIDGQVIGIIDAEHKKKDYFKKEHVETLESVANLVVLQFKSALNLRERNKSDIKNRELLKKLKKSNEELQEYAHIVSHDLKSPLRSIAALTSWIKTDNIAAFDEASLQNFEDLEMTLQNMDNLISDVLKFASLNAKPTEYKPIDLDLLVRNLINVLYVPENISINILNKLPIVKGDKIRFQQLFQNLIDNAIKFSNKEKGFINIDFKDYNSFYKFSVKDNGIGIQEKHFENIFKIFQSLEKAKNSSGIGLSMVKKIVNIYKGEIWLESKIEKGTTFYFTIKK